jgi:hypothetical protein
MIKNGLAWMWETFALHCQGDGPLLVVCAGLLAGNSLMAAFAIAIEGGTDRGGLQLRDIEHACSTGKRAGVAIENVLCLAYMAFSSHPLEGYNFCER